MAKWNGKGEGVATLSCGHTQTFDPSYNRKPTWLNCERCGSGRRVVAS